MAFLRAFGHYLPERVVTNEEIARLAGCSPDWIWQASGIRERRFAEPDMPVAALAARAAGDCLERAGEPASRVGMLIVASSSSEDRFPGPAAAVAHALGLSGVPAVDLPIASAGSLFALALADTLSPRFGNILVTAAEKFSPLITREPVMRDVAILFGDGAGACLVGPEAGLEILDHELCSDGSFSADLRCGADGRLSMNGGVVILQALRKMQTAIDRLLARNGISARDVHAFIAHQANLNLLNRLAAALHAGPDRFVINIQTRGNTSSASLLIAASEWSRQRPPQPGEAIVFAGFGAGFHWGALLAKAPGDAN